MKTYKLNPQMIMTSEELTAYNSLPDNMPDVGLTAKQKELVSTLYYKYITRVIDNQSYNLALYKSEQKEKWLSGPKVKEHEAKRFILNQLVELNDERRLEMGPEDASYYFLACLNWRESCQKVIKAAYQY